MISNWIRETTATTGTGTVTLAGAVSTYIPFSATVGDGNAVWYSIESGNGDRENGIGTFTLSGTTLARTKVVETVVAGALDRSAPTALNLTGTSTVAIVNLAGASDQRITPVSGTDYCSNNLNISGENQSIALVANTLYLMPYLARYIGEYDRIGAHLVGAGTATKSRFGIYRIDQAGIPVELVAETADIATISSFTTYRGTISQFITSEEFAIALLMDGTGTWGSAGVGSSGANYLGMNFAFTYRQWSYTTFAVAPAWTSLPAASALTTIGTRVDTEPPIMVLRGL